MATVSGAVLPAAVAQVATGWLGFAPFSTRSSAERRIAKPAGIPALGFGAGAGVGEGAGGGVGGNALSLNWMVMCTAVLAVLTSDSVAAIAAADAGGSAAKSSTSADALILCGDWDGLPSIVAAVMPELRTPWALMKSRYGPHRMPKFCTIAVTLSGWCGMSDSVVAPYSYSNTPRIIAEAWPNASYVHIVLSCAHVSAPNFVSGASICQPVEKPWSMRSNDALAS